MRKSILICSLIIFFVFCNLLHAQEMPKKGSLYRNIKYKTCKRLFSALKTGDVDLIKGYLSGDMYERYKVLLEQNEAYPDFLRNFYRDAEFKVDRVIRNADGIFVDIMIDFQDGNQSITRMCLKEEKDVARNNIWKVSNMVNEH